MYECTKEASCDSTACGGASRADPQRSCAASCYNQSRGGRRMATTSSRLNRWTARVWDWVSRSRQRCCRCIAGCACADPRGEAETDGRLTPVFCWGWQLGLQPDYEITNTSLLWHCGEPLACCCALATVGTARTAAPVAMDRNHSCNHDRHRGAAGFTHSHTPSSPLRGVGTVTCSKHCGPKKTCS